LFAPRSAAAQALGRVLMPHSPSDARPRLRLTYFGALANSNVLCAATQGLRASLSILAGQIATLKSGPYADLIVVVDGEDRDAALDRLKTRGVQVAEEVP
jgi:ABC-type methionine transport system ATPase subunit